MQPWLKEAMKLFGVYEIVGAKDNPVVVKLYADAGFPGVKDDETPWCAAFVGACLKRVGRTPSGSLMALSYRPFGPWTQAGHARTLKSPVIGSIATKRRGGASSGLGHVFFVTDFDDKHVWGLGGNQRNQVNIMKYDRDELLGYTWPAGVPIPTDRRAGAFRTKVTPRGSEA